MALPFSALSRRCRALEDAVNRGALRLMQHAAATAHREMIVNTPVDKGVARSNWHVSTSPFLSVKAAFVPYPKDSKALGQGVNERANAIAALAQGLPVIRGVTSNRATIYVQNNTPYIITLNTGHVRQIPPGFIERAWSQVRLHMRGLRITTVAQV